MRWYYMQLLGYRLVDEEQKDFDYSWMDKIRRDQYESGMFYVFGVYAEVEIEIRGTVQKIKTEGTWNLMSDEPESVFRNIEKEQVYELIEMLREIGFCEYDIRGMRRLPTKGV
jgi:hypothetical protein